MERSQVEHRRGHYLGTEIDGKWWRRYTADGLLARGLGEFWYDATALYFRRYLTKAPIVISLSNVREISLGRWHAGRWAGGAPVVKVIWQKGDKELRSGFVFSRHAAETEALVQALRHHLEQFWIPVKQADPTENRAHAERP